MNDEEFLSLKSNYMDRIIFLVYYDGDWCRREVAGIVKETLMDGSDEELCHKKTLMKQKTKSKHTYYCKDLNPKFSDIFKIQYF